MSVTFIDVNHLQWRFSAPVVSFVGDPNDFGDLNAGAGSVAVQADAHLVIVQYDDPVAHGDPWDWQFIPGDIDFGAVLPPVATNGVVP